MGKDKRDIARRKPNNTIGRPIVRIEKYWIALFTFSEPDVSGSGYYPYEYGSCSTKHI